jgi:hypothetical protein
VSSCSCIAYLKLTTSEGRALAVGNADAELSLQSHRPAAGSYLGFFKATLEPLSAESAAAAAAPVPTEGTTPLQGSGALKQLQLVWVRDCATVGANEEPADPVAPALSAPVAVEQHAEVHMPEDVPAAAAGAAAADTDALSPTWGDHGSDEDLVTAEPPADPMAVQTTQFGSEDFGAGRDSSALRAATAPASCTAKQAVGFSDGSGSVPTSSCSLSGLGKEVLALSCFGTNLLPTAAADAAGALSPCANLACKLSKESCESSGAFGVGSFCTGGPAAAAARSNSCHGSDARMQWVALVCDRALDLYHYAYIMDAVVVEPEILTHLAAAADSQARLCPWVLLPSCTAWASRTLATPALR